MTMKPSERAAVMRATISDISGGLDACKDAEKPCSHCERLEAYMETEIEAAERDVFKEALALGIEWMKNSRRPLELPNYEDWQGLRDRKAE